MLLALCAAASPASASQPGLRVAHGVHGWFLDSDGEAQLAYGVSPYPSVVVQNAITGSRRLFRGKPCPDSEVYLRPVLVAGGRFLQHCGARWIVTDLRSGAAASVAIPAAIMPNPFVTGLGRVWIEDEVSASPFQPPFVTLFDPTTGDLRQRPQLSATTYLDLDASQPVQLLCAPVQLPGRIEVNTLGGPPVREEQRFAHVVGASGSWVLFTEGEGEGSALLAWRCGAPRARTISPGASSDQLGAGVVTWLAQEDHPPYTVVLYAERLATGRRWHWRSRYGFEKAFHTRSALYASEDCPAACRARGEVAPIVEVSLARL
jgi:hypothetical protein